MTIPLAARLPARSSRQPGPLGSKVPAGGIGLPRPAPARGPYSALLPVGLAVPVLLPVPRWALTPPFHPCPRARRRAVSSLWRFPSGCPGRALPGTVSSWSPDFPRGGSPRLAAIRPSAQAIRYARRQGASMGRGGPPASAGRRGASGATLPAGSRSCGCWHLHRGGASANRRAVHAARPAPFRHRGKRRRQILPPPRGRRC